jgi:hypothetical protein
MIKSANAPKRTCSVDDLKTASGTKATLNRGERGSYRHFADAHYRVTILSETPCADPHAGSIYVVGAEG